MSTPAAVAAHYASEPLLARVIDALAAAGLGSPPVAWEALAPLDEFHVGGIRATRELAAALAPPDGARVLDLGSGLGGPARLLAAEHDADVTGIDLSGEFTAVASELSRRTGQGDRTRFQQGDVTALPFEHASFDHAWTQHVAMNVADRDGFYGEVRRVLVPGGRLAVFDVVARGEGPVTYPVPWATTPATSHLLTAERTIAALGAAGFTTVSAEDLTDTAIGWLGAQRAAATPGPPGPAALGLHVAMGPRFGELAANLAANLISGRLGVLRAVVRAAGAAGATGSPPTA